MTNLFSPPMLELDELELDVMELDVLELEKLELEILELDTTGDEEEVLEELDCVLFESPGPGLPPPQALTNTAVEQINKNLLKEPIDAPPYLENLFRFLKLSI